MAAAGGHPVSRFSTTRWRDGVARLYAANVDSTPGCLARDSVSPSLTPEADVGSFIAKAWISLHLRSRPRDPCAVAWHAARVQCSRGFRLFPFRGPCDAFVSASLFSRVAARQLSAVRPRRAPLDPRV